MLCFLGFLAGDPDRQCEAAACDVMWTVTELMPQTDLDLVMSLLRCFSLFQLYFHHSGPQNRHHQQKRASGNSKKVLLWTTNSGQSRLSRSFAEFKSMSSKSFTSFCLFFLPYILQLSSVRPLWETHLPGVASVWTAAQGEAGGCRARWGCRLSNQPLVASGKEKGHPGHFIITLYSHQHKFILFKKNSN